MNNKIIAENKIHLMQLIKEEIDSYGQECDLNHIDVSKITDMSGLFKQSYFNGSISTWNTANVITMESMFMQSYFCGNVYYWDVSNVQNMSNMFIGPYFYGDISHWKPYNLVNFNKLFNRPNVQLPYWAKFKDLEERKTAIDSYHLSLQLNTQLINKTSKNKLKI